MILHNSNTLKEKTKLENNTLKKLYCSAFLEMNSKNILTKFAVEQEIINAFSKSL
jgi:hypothetical protein